MMRHAEEEIEAMGREEYQGGSHDQDVSGAALTRQREIAGSSGPAARNVSAIGNLGKTQSGNHKSARVDVQV
jgi:hypothetical protein